MAFYTQHLFTFSKLERVFLHNNIYPIEIRKVVCGEIVKKSNRLFSELELELSYLVERVARRGVERRRLVNSAKMEIREVTRGA